MAYAKTITNANVATRFSAEFMAYALNHSYFGQFIGPSKRIAVAADGDPRVKRIIQSSANAIIQHRMEMGKAKGDGITIPMIYPLVGHGRVGTAGNAAAHATASLENHEEGIVDYAFKLLLKEWGHATRDTGTLTRQEAIFSWDSVAMQALGQWWGTMLDQATWNSLAGLAFVGDDATPADVGGGILVPATTPTRKLTGGMAAGVLGLHTTDATLLATEFMCLELISEARRLAIATEPIMRSVNIEGEDCYCLFMSPKQARDLKNNAGVSVANVFNTVHQNASVRGRTNPLFKHAFGFWDGVALFEYKREEKRYGVTGDVAALTTNTYDGTDAVTVANGFVNGGATTGTARAVFCGAQAAMHAYGMTPKFVTENFDYQREHGVSVQSLIAIEKPCYNSKDYGVMCIDTAVKGG